MALVRMLKPGQPRNQDPCTIAVGGAESNVAVGLARLGHSVRWISALGQDSFGDMIVAVLENEGVEVVAARSPEHPTGLMVKSPSRGDERFVSYYRSGSAAANMTPEMVSPEMIADARLLHITGITPALSESARQTLDAVLDYARHRNITVSFDLNYRPALWSRSAASSAFTEIVSSADMVFGDRLELSMLTDASHSSAKDLVESIQGLGVADVIVKQGSEGAVALVGDEFVQQDAVPVEVIDTVGAGDAFVAGYLSALLDGESPERRLERGVFCGARACRDPGDWEGSPTRKELTEIDRRTS
jgi:2-dehydro-3-deoxygluconokinase